MKIIRPLAVSDSVLTASSLPEDDHSAYGALTTYDLGDRVIVLATHSIYESVIDSNGGNDPTTDDGTNWVRVGATNKWKPFDKVLGDAATGTASITYQFSPGDTINNAIAFFGMSADSVRVVMTDPSDGVVYDMTASLADNQAVSDWYSYFFEPIVRLEEYVITDLPAFTGITIDVTVTGSGAIAVGEIVPGHLQELGLTEYGSSIGIADYSRKDRDAYGNPYIVERAFALTVDFDFVINTVDAAKVRKVFADYRATPIVWIGSATQHFGAIVYGYYKGFTINLTGEVKSFCTAEVEGLI